MSNPTSNRVRGELLREWRFSQKWDVNELAKRVNLSIGQIQQLETGGTSLFYSTAIRENAARKVAAMLGADPDSVIRADDAPVPAGTDSKIVDDLVVLSRQRARATLQPSIFVRHPGLIAAVLVSLAGLIAAASWLQQKWQNGGAQQFWRDAAVTSSSAPATAQAPVSPLVASPASAAAASHAVDSAADASAMSVVATDPASSPAVAAVASDSLVAASANHPLCQSAVAGAVITPAHPSKAGDMVYIVAQKVGTVCVVDAAGVRTVLSLKPQEARSVYGAAPWRVNFELAEQAQLYFQGERLRLPDATTTAVALHEAARPQ